MKKGISILLALTLLVSMMAPFTASADGWELKEAIQGTGSVVTAESQEAILSGVLPTGHNLDFVIDPAGLIGATPGTIIGTVQDNDTVVFGGEDGNVLFAWNTSSVPVVFSVELQLTANADDAANIITWVEPSEAAITTLGDVDADEFKGTDSVVVFGTDKETIRFLLDEVAHKIAVAEKTAGDTNPNLIPTVKSRVDGEPSLNGTALQFAGIINTEYNWSEAGELKVEATFSLGVASDEAIAAIADTASLPYGWLNSFEGYVAPALVPVPTDFVVDAGPQLPVGPKATASFNAAGSLLTINAEGFEFPSGGTWTVQGFSTRDNTLITLSAAAGAVNRVSDTQITVTFNAAWSNSGIHQGVGATHFIISNGNHSVRVDKPNGTASAISAATVTIS